MKIKHAAKHLARNAQVQSPTILSALAVIGVAGTAYLTFKATWKASQVITEEEERGQEATGDIDYQFKTSARIEKIWKLYIPAAGVGVGTITCIVASNRIAVRRLAALAAAYGLLSGDFDEYRDKAIELLGDKKAKIIDDEVAMQKVHSKPPPNVPFELQDGSSWFCDLSTMRYYRATRGEVEKGRNDLNHFLMNETYASLNEAYGFLGLEGTGVGDQLGWGADNQVELVFTPVFMPDGSTATAFSFKPEPKPDFDSLH